MYDLDEVKMRYHRVRRTYKLSENWDDLDELTQALIYYLYNKGACFDAILWVVRNTDKYIYELWNTCKRGDWLSWLVGTTHNVLYLELFYTIEDDHPTIQEYARKWAAKRIKQNYNAHYTMTIILNHYREVTNVS